ncbi:hypothetical protein A0J48_009880 [Sphaerospermopsis aphanizomenoides BCCUSP55]|uniref:hypothetical protein n=1 Tax=Sphaerospermopsis aphanizomenoides TaxID=459663 RepID=UPI000A3DA357|nr:hypothetical protein [Sphaerospermopsis aphanizomenoides]MBK1987844.1 hypothetical protein [Sphaerospermopsis aphanizomenoides BCCUSP55]
MFGFIKNLIAGIFGFITGLFGKKDGYYLELKEEATPTKPAAAKPEVATAPTSVAAPKAAAKAPTANKVEPAKAPAAKAEPAKPQVPTETNFATKYLMPSSSNSRRRPGANMNTYLDMARQVKTPG